MRIFMTGVTSFQSNINRPVNHLYSGASALQYALRENHEVMNGSPWDVEKFPGGVAHFDLILCGLYTISAIVSGGAESSALLVREAMNQHVPVIFYVDDWHLNSIASGYKNLSDPARAYQVERHAKLTTKEPDRVKTLLDNIAGIQYVYRIIHNGRFPDQPFKVLVPTFPWCMRELKESMMTMFNWGSESIKLYDPTNVFPPVPCERVAPEDKAREWVLSSRYDQSKFVEHLHRQGLQWPIKSYGCRKNGDELLPNELDLVEQAYAPRWGVLSHSYPSALQGQWRNRFMFASTAKSIVYCEGKEADPELMRYSLREIETMSTDQLATYEDYQRVWLMEHAWEADRCKQFIDNVIYEVMR